MELNEYEVNHLNILRESLAECCVLLRSDGAFPLKQPCRIAAYGNGVRKTIKGGTGSGEVNSRYFVNIEGGLETAGFVLTSKNWLDSYDELYIKARKEFVKKLKAEAKQKKMNAVIYGMGKPMPEFDHDLPLDFTADAAIYVLSRISGEGNDRSPIKGDVLLSDTEVRDILLLNEQYEKFMLVTNSGGVVDLSPVKDVKNILILSQLGVETGTALADILLGKANPSGKLAATWSAWDDYARIGTFGEHNDTDYKEGIYVGYRYFDSIGKKALFPFGYGLSYTSFETDNIRVSAEKSIITVKADVKNTGSYPGKEVVQVYVSCPAGKFDKPYQELAGFAKTKELKINEKQEIEIIFDLRDLAGFDEEKGIYLLEEGRYLIRVGNSSIDTAVSAIIELGEDAIIKKVRNLSTKPSFADWKAEIVKQETSEYVPVIRLHRKDIASKDVDYEHVYEIEEKLKDLSDEELALLNVGAFDPKGGIGSLIGNASTTVAGAAGETSSIMKDRGFKPLIMADGPAGVRITPAYYRDEKGAHGVGQSGIPESVMEFMPSAIQWLMKKMGSSAKVPAGTKVEYQYCTALPIGTAVAQSWNIKLAERYGDIVGDEMERFRIHLWLAPALNIQRSILCGRNFEYYSEDPLISGKLAAAVVRGVQKHKGRGVTIKHFAANNQETNRYGNSSNVSERALREIYLKGFEICIRESDPVALMTSYNLINGVHSAESRQLCEDVLRCEFGFKGIIMTDWLVGNGAMNSKEDIYPKVRPSLVAAAGGDLFMPGCKADYEDMLKGLKEGSLTRQQLLVNVSRVYRLSQNMNGQMQTEKNDHFYPGKKWLDDKGVPIEAHGGTMYQEDGVYYWLGEDKSHTSQKGKIWTWGVRLYSSIDLYNWKDEGHIVEPQSNDRKSLFHPYRRLDRPHLLKNPHTGKYVLWLKYSDKSHYSILTADDIRGPYQLDKVFFQPFDHKCGDFDLALDEVTGDAYLYYEADHKSLRVVKLDRSFTDIQGEEAVIFYNVDPPLTREAPAHFMRNGKHYLITSGMTGYVPNPLQVAIADNWMGPFKVLVDPCIDDDSSAGFNSQPSYVFRVNDTYVLMADRWVPDYIVTKEIYGRIYRAIASRFDKSVRSSFKDFLTMIRSPLMASADTSKSLYIWLPFEWNADIPVLKWKDEWKISEVTGNDQ